LQDIATSRFLICLIQLYAVSRICEANVRVLPVRGSVTWISFAQDMPRFAYLRTPGSVVRLQCCAINGTYPRTMYSKNLHVSHCLNIKVRKLLS
jgi:hypothetical protein